MSPDDRVASPPPEPRRRVLVLLPRDLDVATWQQQFPLGLVPDMTPYGYHHARALGYDIVYSPASDECGAFARLLNRALWRTFGFDLLHVWRSRRFISQAMPDAVWTHTEHEYLAFLLLRRLGILPAIPLVAQSVWLADGWRDIGWLRQRLVSWLIRDAEVCTFHSPLNAEFALQRGWGKRTRVVEFGVSLDAYPLRAPIARPPSGAIRVLAVGNDRHRDWNVLHRAFANDSAIEVRVASSRYPKSLASPNIKAGSLSQDELRDAYEWADVVVVPLTEQLHVSGITVICEAVTMGRPVVASRAGGLDHYFTDEHIRYVPVGDAISLARRVREVAEEGQDQQARLMAAQARFVAKDFSTIGYARRHVELTELLLKAKDESLV